MDNFADDREVVPACSDEQVMGRRADCEIHHRAYDLEQETVDEEKRRVRIAVPSDALALVKRSHHKLQMAGEGATECAVFLDTDDFATASSYMPSGGLAGTVNGILDHNDLEGDPLSYVSMSSAKPRFICATAELPNGAVAGDAITVDGTAYTVRVIQPEGTGVTTSVLEKISRWLQVL